MREIMIRAWAMSKKAAREFGGKASEYIAEAMKIAWADEKHYNSIQDAKNAVQEEVAKMKEDIKAMVPKMLEVMVRIYKENGVDANKIKMAKLEQRHGADVRLNRLYNSHNINELKEYHAWIKQAVAL